MKPFRSASCWAGGNHDQQVSDSARHVPKRHKQNILLREKCRPVHQSTLRHFQQVFLTSLSLPGLLSVFVKCHQSRSRKLFKLKVNKEAKALSWRRQSMQCLGGRLKLLFWGWGAQTSIYILRKVFYSVASDVCVSRPKLIKVLRP